VCEKYKPAFQSSLLSFHSGESRFGAVTVVGLFKKSSNNKGLGNVASNNYPPGGEKTTNQNTVLLFNSFKDRVY